MLEMPAHKSVLVVDDNEMMRDLLARNLEFQGLRVHMAASGSEALAGLERQPADLILLDIMMPGMSGLEVLTRLKEQAATRDIPVLVLSADSDIEQVVRCIDLGAEDYLVKPFNTTLLQARVAACLEKRHLRVQEQAYQRLLEERVAERSALAEQRGAALSLSEEALERQTTILQSILHSMGDGVVVVDTSGALVHHNPAASHILGARLEQLLPGARQPLTMYRDAAHSIACPPAELPLARAIRGDESEAIELLTENERGEAQWLSINARPVRDADGRLIGGVAVVHDISDAKLAELALRESEQRYALAARGANDGLWDWDVPRDRVYYSPRWKSMLGYGDHEIGNSLSAWLELVHVADREQLETRLIAHHRRLISHFEHEYRILHRDGTYRWMLCRGLAVWDEAGRVTRMAGSQTDITERKSVEQQLLYDAFHDSLTGLPNRALFIDRLDQVLARLRHNPSAAVVVLFLDLDRFKIINDSLGHAAGDQLLRTIAARLTACVRARDTVARLAGDEFTVLIEDEPDSAALDSMIDNIQRAISEPIDIGNTQIATTASIGFVIGSAAYSAATDMIRDADIAMYQAKIAGKGHVMRFDASMHTRAIVRLQLESELRKAIDHGELRVYYQPIVSFETGNLAGVEALVRWQHPTRGLLAPAEFLYIAEETGLIIPLSWWTLRQACMQLRSWQREIAEASDLWVSVNISARQLAQHDMLEQLLRVLDSTGLDPHCLKLEMTEHTLLEHGEATLRTLDTLRDLGVQLCIDDFGTGYSSLSYLQRFPVDVLKIDRSFINQMGEDRRRNEIVQTILGLARSLSLVVVAEGTETLEQASELQRQRCEYGQGWLFSKAVDATVAGELIRGAASFALPNGGAASQAERA
jgi:diguanylate cyclase (GGDEF)-like protein/PAS domain S-box-containing protein